MNRPIPETTISNLANSHEDTLLLLDLMRHKRQQEGQKKRVRTDKVTRCPEKSQHPTTGIPNSSVLLCHEKAEVIHLTPPAGTERVMIRIFITINDYDDFSSNESA